MNFDVLVSYDAISLFAAVKNPLVQVDAVFIDTSDGKPHFSILHLCAERKLKVYYIDASIPENFLSQKKRTDFLCGIDGSLADSFFVGNSKTMRDFKRNIVLASQSEIPVLLVGENGTGKSLAARTIHCLSKRAENEFFDVNVAAIPENLDKSSLFLDEIGEMSCFVQAKLLKVLDSGEFRKVGSDKVQKSDVRLICATNANLRKKIVEKEFREDLYYRIAGFEIYVPPLRERKDDIPELAIDFLKKSGKRLSHGAQEILKTCDWRGNIRQFHNCLNRAVLFSQERNEILPEDIVF